MSTQKNVFISHHHGDDSHVDSFQNMLGRGDYHVRNSSVRMKPANERRVKEGRVSDNTIKRLLRMKMRWASTVVVLIGPKTHTRPWVNWEIEQAHKLGKRIVGVYLHGGTAANVPSALDDYGQAIVKWSTKSIVEAIEGKNTRFEEPSGDLRDSVHAMSTSRC
ncbi:MAG: TIR domain-containing protein [Tabrizicola sp.]|uniref:TIR domain-containing protein n=1 Tax=Tabrizicola sp. TaxID=2005166 RepID=UPI003BB10BAF